MQNSGFEGFDDGFGSNFSSKPSDPFAANSNAQDPFGDKKSGGAAPQDVSKPLVKPYVNKLKSRILKQQCLLHMSNSRTKMILEVTHLQYYMRQHQHPKLQVQVHLF